MAFTLALGKYALAAKRSHPDKLAKTRAASSHPVIAAVIAAAAAAASSGLLSSVPARLDQGQSGACTAHSLAAALATRCTFAKLPPSFVASPRELYSCTRAWERAASTPAGTTLAALTDSGAELADVVASVAVFGVSPMQGPTPDGRNSDVWTDADIASIPNAPPANVNNDPDGQQLEAAASDPLTGTYTIDLTASNAVATGVATLQAGFPLYCGFFCDSAFQALTFGQVAQAPNQNDPNGGGHAIFLVDFRESTAVPGTYEFLLVNSWNGWAGAVSSGDGMVWVSQAFYLAMWEAHVVDENLVTARKEAA